MALAEALTSPGVRVLLVEEPLVAVDPARGRVLPERLRARAARRAARCSWRRRRCATRASWPTTTCCCEAARSPARPRRSTSCGVPAGGRSGCASSSSDPQALVAAVAREAAVEAVARRDAAVVARGRDATALAAAVGRAVTLGRRRGRDAPRAAVARRRSRCGRRRRDRDVRVGVRADARRVASAPPARRSRAVIAALARAHARAASHAARAARARRMVRARARLRASRRAHAARPTAPTTCSSARSARSSCRCSRTRSSAASLGGRSLAASTAPLVVLRRRAGARRAVAVAIAVAACAALGAVARPQPSPSSPTASADPPAAATRSPAPTPEPSAARRTRRCFALGATFGKRGGGRTVLLVARLAPRHRATGALALVTPRAHLRNLLGGAPPDGIGPSAASAVALLVLAVVFAPRRRHAASRERLCQPLDALAHLARQVERAPLEDEVAVRAASCTRAPSRAASPAARPRGCPRGATRRRRHRRPQHDRLVASSDTTRASPPRDPRDVRAHLRPARAWPGAPRGRRPSWRCRPACRSASCPLPTPISTFTRPSLK